MNPRYPTVASRANHQCEYCRAPEALFNFPFEVEHIFPTSLMGADSEANLALACRSCNLGKSDFLDGLDEVTGSMESLFNPRRDRWSDHFELDIDRGEIRGISSTGRATVARLRMNEPVQIMARLLWIRLRLFP